MTRNHLIISGTGTTFRATHSFVAILTNNPELQKRLQQEVDEAVGDETARLADKEKMPYMEAVSCVKSAISTLASRRVLFINICYLEKIVLIACCTLYCKVTS